MPENKEIINRGGKEEKFKKEILIDLKEDRDLPKEVQSWFEKLERTAPKQIDDDVTGQPLLTPANPINPKIVMPITRRKFVEGFKQTIEEASRWLSEFLFRIIKIKKGEVKFKEE